MTQWIDDFARSLEPKQRDANDAYQREQLRLRLIRDRAPAFFKALADEVQRQAAELESKVGGLYPPIQSRIEPHLASVLTGKNAVAVVFRLNQDNKSFTSDTTRAGGTANEGGRHRDFTFQVNADKPDDDSIWAVWGETVYRDPAEIATAVLQEAFTKKVL